MSREKMIGTELPQKDVLFLGGHQNMTKKLRQVFPGWTYITDDQLRRCTCINQSLVFYWTNHSSHKLMRYVYSKLPDGVSVNTATDYIIVHPDGKPIYPEYLSQMLTKLQEKAGLPKCRFHDLRHLCASIMLLQGVNVKVAQERLGHKDIATTMNIYSHVLPSSAKEAADKIGQLVYAV